MPARAMNMSMGKLFFCSVAHVTNSNIEMQGFPGEWMVTVDLDLLVFHGYHGKDLCARFCLRLELHAGFYFIHSLEEVFVYILNEGIVPESVTLFRRYRHLYVFAGAFSFQSFFQS